MFSVNTTQEDFKNATITSHFGFVFDCDYRDAIVFGKLRFQNVTRAHENEKPALSNSFGLKSVFEKLGRFRDGLVWTVSLTVELKLRFKFPRRNVDGAYKSALEWICASTSFYFCPIKVLSTRIRKYLNPQLFLFGYGFRPHASGEFSSESGYF